MTLWNECARLISNAIIYFNALFPTNLLAYFTKQGDEKELAIIKQTSPVAWHNIYLNGTYKPSLEPTSSVGYSDKCYIRTECPQNPRYDELLYDLFT